MEIINLVAWLVYIPGGILSWLRHRNRLTAFLPARLSPTQWFLLIPVFFLATTWRELTLVPFMYVPDTDFIWGYVPYLASSWQNLRGTIIDNSLEEISRFGLWFFLLAYYSRRFGAFLISVCFAAIHIYDDLAPIYSEILGVSPVYLVAFGISFVFLAVGFRYGIFVAFVFHLLMNELSVGFLLVAPGGWVWLNWLLAALVWVGMFWLLRLVPVKPVFAAYAAEQEEKREVRRAG